MRTLLCLLLLVMTALTCPAADDADVLDEEMLTDQPASGEAEPAEDAAAAQPAGDDDAAEEEQPRFTPPSVRDIAQQIAAQQPGLKGEGYTDFMKSMGLLDQKGVLALFARFRELDRDVLDEGKSTFAEICEGKYSNPVKNEGAHFDIVFEKRLTEAGPEKDGSPRPQPGSILSAADTAFQRATEMLMADPFMHWAGRVKGRIYLITSEDQWKSVRRGKRPTQPVQMVITQDDEREFFVLANAMTAPYIEQAVAYAVAELVAKEYAKAIANERESKLPPVMLAGLGVNASDLECVVTEEGPVQVDRYQNREFPPALLVKMRAAAAQNPSIPTQLPLDENKLIEMRDLVRSSNYGKDDEDVYYFMRQSAYLTEYLRNNGQLAFLLMTRALADGEDFEESFDDYYVPMREELLGERATQKQTERTRPSSRQEAARMKKERDEQEDARQLAEDALHGYKELREAADKKVFFDSLTEDRFEEEQREQRRGSRTN